VWKTVPCSRSSMREAVLSELGSAPRLGSLSCVGGSETRWTAGTTASEIYIENTLEMTANKYCFGRHSSPQKTAHTAT